MRLALAALLSAVGNAALAWVYPEHRDLSLLAVSQLDPDRRGVFDRLWMEARAGDEARLCPLGADSGQALTPSCIDWAALAAIAGDHSCSSREMFDTARSSDWILLVADVAAQLKLDLARIPVTETLETRASTSDPVEEARRRIETEATRAQRVNALRTADIRLQRADSQYATRAGSNNAHFLLARPATGFGPHDYADIALRPGSDLNAVGVYTYFHLSALQKASRLRSEQLSPEQRRSLARAVMADEAFALHFLQDVYAAGHIAGAWGNASQRQGTHDYYNQNGLEVFTWEGGSKSTVLMGDANMRPEDAQVAASAVRRSLEQLLDAASGSAAVAAPTPTAPPEPDAFNVCSNKTFPEREPALRAQPEHRTLIAGTLYDTPVPGLGPGLGAMPRFRSEVGPFVGLAGSIDARGVDGGFVVPQSTRGLVTGLDLSFRAGFGLDGVMGDAGDGLVYASIGLRADSPSTNRFSDVSRGVSGGNLSAAIPARSAISLRFRMPYYLIPGDLLLAAPLYLFDKKAYANLAVTAANGGLLHWQSGWATAIGRFQFVLGRELGVTYYGYNDRDELIAPSADAGGIARIVRLKSTGFELPIVEYRPYRAFSTNQSSSVLVQLFVGADVPRGASTVVPVGAPVPATRTVWFLGLRLVSDWRYYF
ncbi:hypothetical protein EGT07_14710 [Herbaspirillum sp. HC18]|nr:hypothetical protein EGT07_14710 [Herbaspirillum sp. HC18]